MSSLAFEIGFDHYRYDLPLDISRFQDNQRQQIRYGYEAAKMQKVSQRKPDLYEKKLMTLRDRALVKGLEVSISTQDLIAKLEESKGRCPITLLPFTFAENNATDWSVDRVDNTLGYCPDNIVIVSVIANQAKSGLDLAGIIKTALRKAKTEDLLNDREWLRMARFYYHKMKIMKPLCLCLLLAESQSLYDQIVFMQLFMNQEKRAKAFLKQLEKYIGKGDVMKAAKLTQKRAYHRADIDVEVLYDSPKLYRWVRSFIAAINAHRAEFDPLLMECLFA
ncbi:hypothetical protein [Candidatus Methylobacter oryzae]|uniref:Uncharacterized protein n=1 Tax=Candidatus Methylobacter oryzae TaxID=2497749 RepID=A0ABY3CB36_9GAMM|nr:hypothetical protein [Candidatus Methylobacter oryzae]TRW95827.1 hypothetical protein EKO24_009475 [Candidatus Methylobacter oryzae]